MCIRDRNEEDFKEPIPEFAYFLCQELLDECSPLDIRIYNVIAVSYTHLAVYKRQGNYGAATAGNYGAATARGTASTGSNGMSVARGNNVRVKGGIGSILVIAEEKMCIRDRKEIAGIKTIYVRHTYELDTKEMSLSVEKLSLIHILNVRLPI